MPASTSSATPAEVQAALTGESASLRALMIGGLFSAHAHTRHPLRAVVVAAPDLPSVLLRLAEQCDATLRMPGDDDGCARLLEALLADVRAAAAVLAPLLAQLRRRAEDEVTELSTSVRATA